jgi:hypothetical protein
MSDHRFACYEQIEIEVEIPSGRDRHSIQVRCAENERTRPILQPAGTLAFH